MLEYFAYKKYKQHKLEKSEKEEERKTAATSLQATAPTLSQPGRPTAMDVSEQSSAVAVLDADEQSFFERLTLRLHMSNDDDDDGDDDVQNEQRPPLPPRLRTPELTWDSDSESFVHQDMVRTKEGREQSKAKEKEKEKQKRGWRLSQVLGRGDKKAAAQKPDHLLVPQADGSAGALVVVNAEEASREGDDLALVLAELDLAAGGVTGGNGENENKDKNKNKDTSQTKMGKLGVAMSAQSTELVRSFVLVLRDLANGVPTAVDDLRHLLDQSDGSLSRGFEKLPSSLRKLVTQLPDKLTASLAPELLAAAAESQGVAFEQAAGESAKAAGTRAAKSLALPLLTSPSAIVKMLKAIMNALKLRWPAFIGTSAIWSVAVFILLFVLWYCHKRGREVRLEKEASATATASAIASASTTAIDTDADMAALPAPSVAIEATSPEGTTDELLVGQLPPPPMGEFSKK